jgi:YbbR domain-containing protein
VRPWVPNLALKLLSLFLAFVVWFVVSAPRRESVSERAFAAPLSLIGMPRELMITTPVPDTINVRLRGRGSDLRALSSQNLEVTLDLRWVQPGEAQVTLRPQAINVPPNVEVISMDPTKVHFRVEQLRQRAVPIRPFLVGQPPNGYIAGDPTVAPDQALVSGPASQVRNVSEVATERIIMTGRTDTFTQSVAVVSDAPLVRIIEPLTTQVTVPVYAEVGPNPPAETTATTSTAATTTTTTSSAPKKKAP